MNGTFSARHDTCRVLEINETSNFKIPLHFFLISLCLKNVSEQSSRSKTHSYCSPKVGVFRCDIPDVHKLPSKSRQIQITRQWLHSEVKMLSDTLSRIMGESDKCCMWIKRWKSVAMVCVLRYPSLCRLQMFPDFRLSAWCVPALMYLSGSSFI